VLGVGYAAFKILAFRFLVPVLAVR